MTTIPVRGAMGLVALTLMASPLCALPAAAADISLRFGHMNSTEHVVHKGAEMMKQGIEERTDGAVTIDLFPNAQLGENAQVTEQIAFGADYMAQVGAGHLADHVPDYNILLGPFLYEDGWNDAKKLIGSDLVKGWEEQLAGSNLKVLCYMNFGVRDLYTRSREVHTPGDTANLKIRVQPVTIYTEMIQGMGAAPTPMPWAEVYNALAQGVIDAAEAPPAAMLDQKHYEVVEYYMQTNHMLDVVPIIMSQSAFDRASPEQQQIISEEAQAACDWMTSDVLAGYDAAVASLEEKGVTVIRDVDRAAFAKATAATYTKFPEWTPGLYDEVQAILND